MIGAIIGNRYKVLRRLGSGGMATVYRAQDLRLLREVALKVMLPADGEEGADGAFFFHREARAIAALQHPNIVQIFDYAGPQEAQTYIVMELVEGPTLQALLDDRGPLPEPVVRAVSQGVAAALAHAHSRGVIHRDIKPGNVMIDASGRVLLMDFGIAKGYADAARLGATMVGRQTQLCGTPEFMAPEQVLDQPVGPYTDVFALGALCYAMAAGHSPFEAVSPVDTMARIMDLDYLPLRESRRGLSSSLGALVSACLERDPERRPAAGAIARACERWLMVEAKLSPAESLARFVPGKGSGLPGGRPEDRDASDDGPTTVDMPCQEEPGTAAVRSDQTVRHGLPTAPSSAPHNETLGTRRVAIPRDLVSPAGAGRQRSR